MIEKIYNCNVCLSYAKSIAKENYEEIFSLALEKIIVQNPQNVENYQSYFYTTLKNEYLSYINKNKDLIFVEEYFNEAEPEQENNYKIALESFLSKETTDEEYIFYQDLIYLSFENSKLSLCSKLKLRRANLDLYLNQAHKLIEDEYNRIVNN
tara:strand:- start:150 stop:608 length:459 start_codon:yes stop_codon:yes gene_type:complete